MRKLILIAATAGGVGYVPFAPGSFGSAVGVGLWAALAQRGMAAGVLGAAVVALLAVAVAQRAQALLARSDDQRIVIDEVAGTLVALAGLPLRWDVALVGFALFRMLDISKPPPCRRLERLPGGAGVVADDLMAGLYANALAQLWFRAALPGWAA
jgi:phosphatidylglycerophosphatase A